MQWEEVVDAIGKPVSDTEAIASIRAEHGTGAARWLAERLGVSARTARRYMAGVVPGKRSMAVRDAAPRARVAANALRKAQTIQAPQMAAEEKSPKKTKGARRGAQTRRMKEPKRVTKDGRAALQRAADRLDAGDMQGAKDEVDKAVLSAYGTDALNIIEYIDGIDIG